MHFSTLNSNMTHKISLTISEIPRIRFLENIGYLLFFKPTLRLFSLRCVIFWAPLEQGSGVSGRRDMAPHPSPPLKLNPFFRSL